MISLNQISLSLASRTLFESASCQIFAGEKVGLTGANGSGKSTLFKILQSKLELDAGECQIAGDPVIAYTEQETHASELSAVDYVLTGDRQLCHWQQQLAAGQAQQDNQLIAKANSMLDELDAWSANNRAAKLLTGLGFAQDELSKSVNEFSGGWRMRLNLAKALMAPSDILLLDEPTNHLDLDAILWLERWLQNYQGTLMLISHDRAFLDNCIEKIISIEQCQLLSWQGNYSAYEKLRAEQIILAGKQQKKVAAKQAQLQQFIDRFRAQASKAKQVQSRIKAMERLESASILQTQSAYQFSFKEPTHAPRPLLKIDEASIGYDNKPLLEGIDLTLNAGDCLGILGPNGAGKSTLIKHIVGKLPLITGDSWLSKNANIGFFAQHQLEQLDVSSTPIASLIKAFPELTEQQAQDYLGGFGFRGERVSQQIANFSGGEKSRLVLALIIKQAPNFLLLDEPTNHLDIDMRESLTLALQNYTGALLVVSHDRHLLEAVCDRFLLVADHQINYFDGDLKAYQDWLKQRNSDLKKNDLKKNELDQQVGAQNANQDSVNKKQLRQQQAAARAKTAPLRKQINKLEKQLESDTEQLATIEQQLADTELYQAQNKKQLNELLELQGKLTKSLQATESEWLELHEQLELAEG
jgi:ATP-binding cassette, subfamily F, member 3